MSKRHLKELERHHVDLHRELMPAIEVDWNARLAANRSFELPTRMFALFATACFAFLAITWMAFGNAELAIPMVIFAVFIAMFFAVPAAMLRIRREETGRNIRWPDFAAKGIVTHTGMLTAREAAAQMFVLPAVLVGWGVAVAVIAASVR